MAMARLALTPALPLVAGSFSDASTQASSWSNAARIGSASRLPLLISYQTRRLSTRALSAPKGKFCFDDVNSANNPIDFFSMVGF